MVSQLGMIRKKKYPGWKNKISCLNFFIEIETVHVASCDHRDSIQAMEMEAES